MLAVSLPAILSHWRRHPIQLAMLLLGLCLATALWSAVQSINGEARASYARAAAVLAQDSLTQIVHADGDLIDQTVFARLRTSGWLVTPVVNGELRLGGTRYRLIGVDPVSLPPEARMTGLPEPGNGFTAFISPPWQFLAHPETATRVTGLTGSPIVASSSLMPGTLVTDIGHAQKLLGLEGSISRLIEWKEQPAGRKPLAQVAPGLVERAPGTSSDISRLTDSFHLNLTAFGFLSFAVGLFIVHAAVGLAFEQRRITFRTMRALGLPAIHLIGALMIEALLLSVVAGLAGVALGYGVAAVLLPDVAATLKGLYGAEVPGGLTVRPAVWAAGLAIAAGGTLFSTSGYLVRTWQQPLMNAARPLAWIEAHVRSIRRQAVAGISMLVVAAAMAWLATGLAAGFIMIGLLFLGAAFALPLALSSALKLGTRLARAPLTQWFWADARQQLPGLSLALMALLLALATNIGVGTMVSSFRQTFVGWLDQRLASELYVTARTEAEAQRIAAFLKDRADAVLPIWHVEGTAAGQPVEIYGVADQRTYRDNWPIIEAVPGVWDEVAAGRGLLVNEQLWRRGRLALGQSLLLPRGLSLPVAGVYSDYGNPIGQVIISNDQLTDHFPEVQRLRYGVRIAPALADGLADALRDRFGLPRENVVSQAGIKAFSLGVFDRTFTVTAALNILTLGVATIAMFANLLTLANMRLPSVAPVWAMGVRLKTLAWLDLARGLMLAVLTMVAAIPLGIALSWALLAIVNVEAFGWRLPFHLFPWDWLRLAIMAVAAALAAAALPSWSLAHTPPARLTKVFAHER